MEQNEELKNQLKDALYKISLQDEIIKSLKEFKRAYQDCQFCKEACSKLNATGEDHAAFNDANLNMKVKMEKLYSQLDEYNIKMRYSENPD